MQSLLGSKQVYSIQQGAELRLEVAPKRTVFLSLLKGSAEVFGTELFVGHPVRLTGQKLAVFTWQGCELELSCHECEVQAALESIYQADETPMAAYVNTHGLLEQRRRAAKAGGKRGPRTFIVGPTDVGKSSLAKLLLSYAVRMHWQPTMVDLDIGQGAITVPGSIAATPVESPVDIEEGLPLEVPLVFYYGHASPTENPELYRHLVEQLAQLLDRREALNAEVAASGLVVNSMGWIEDLGYQLLLHSIRALSIDVVLVVGAERLFHTLQQALSPSPGVSVVKLQKSGGVVARSPALRKTARAERTREYFYGVRGDLQPQAQTARFDELQIYRIGSGPKPSANALPIGMQAVSEPLRVQQIPPSGDLLHALLGLSHAKTPEQLLAANTAGFLYVTDVNPVLRTITYLAPTPGPLPCKYLLTGSLRVIVQ